MLLLQTMQGWRQVSRACLIRLEREASFLIYRRRERFNSSYSVKRGLICTCTTIKHSDNMSMTRLRMNISTGASLEVTVKASNVR